MSLFARKETEPLFTLKDGIRLAETQMKVNESQSAANIANGEVLREMARLIRDLEARVRILELRGGKMKPPIPLTDRRFVYTNSHNTCLAETFRRVRAEQAQKAALERAGITNIKRVAK